MKILRNFTDWLSNRSKRHIMSLTEFEYWTNLKLNHETLLYEWGDIKLTEGIVRDAWKRGNLEGLANALMKRYSNIYSNMMDKR